jgi:mannose-6-phosphate isomerase-like protein (cupin superfamily)
MTYIDGGGVVLVPGEGRQVVMGGFDIVVLATAESTSGAYSLLETSEPTPKGGPPLHIHHDAAESFYVVAGAYSMHLDGKDFHCPPGSYVYVPAGMAHTFRVLEAGSRKLNLFTPAAMVGYFDDLARAIADGTDEAGLEEIAEHYAMEVLGPAPEDYLSPRAGTPNT